MFNIITCTYVSVETVITNSIRILIKLVMDIGVVLFFLISFTRNYNIII